MTHIRILTIAALLATSAAAQPPDNAGVAVGFLKQVFNRHQVDEAAQTYLGPVYVQHDLDSLNGTSAFLAALKADLAANPQASIEVKRVIADGHLVLVHSHYHQKPGDLGTAGVDLFRLQNGKLVEHWEVRQPVSKSSANGHSMFGSVYPDVTNVDARTVARNKLAARMYLAALFNPKTIAQAVKTYLPAEGYIQHNPNIPDGAQALQMGLEMGYKQGTTFAADIKQVLGEGDLVATYSLYRIGTPQGTFNSVTVDIFRFTGGKISEHWDIGQPVSDKPAAPSGQF